MVNVFFELDRLRTTLDSKGVDMPTINAIVEKARQEIDEAVSTLGSSALDNAVEIGAEKNAPDFINELRFDTLNFEVTTASGNMDFSIPPYPMLNSLLKNAKPMKDGSGVYKIIPVGKPGNKAPMSNNIYDAQKRITAERVETAKKNYKNVAPAGSKKQEFRTASSKQDASTQWVKPAQEKDFASDIQGINANLHASLDDKIRDIINNYLEMF